MNVSAALVAFVAGWEALRLIAYLDGGGVPTIGYGHTLGVSLGQTCTVEQAEAWLHEELDAAAHGLGNYLTRTPTQQQFDALVSLAYNCGVGAIGQSGLMARFNAGLDRECADRFLLWNKDNGREVAGLTKRRRSERAIYLVGNYAGRP